MQNAELRIGRAGNKLPSCVPQFRCRSNAFGIASRCSMHSRINIKEIAQHETKITDL